jgi:hypothetical protein
MVIIGVAGIVVAYASFWAIVFGASYQRRNRIFRSISTQYSLQLVIRAYQLNKIVRYGEKLELRRLDGIVHGKRIIISESFVSGSIVAPWWYQKYIFPFAQTRETLFSIDGETKDIGERRFGRSRFASLARLKENLQLLKEE